MIVYIIIAVTVIVSIMAFKNRNLFYKLSLSPYNVVKKNEWYRVISHAFVHGSTQHLLINMLVLWSFGVSVYGLMHYISSDAETTFLWLYFGAVILSALFDTLKYKHNYLYNSIGASAGVNAVIFASILFSPWNKIYFFAIIPIPALLFGAAYIWYESYLNRLNNKGDNVNHYAHLIGAAWGFVFPIIIEPSLLGRFFSMVLGVLK